MPLKFDKMFFCFCFFFVCKKSQSLVEPTMSLYVWGSLHKWNLFVFINGIYFFNCLCEKNIPYSRCFMLVQCIAFLLYNNKRSSIRKTLSLLPCADSSNDMKSKETEKRGKNEKDNM